MKRKFLSFLFIAFFTISLSSTVTSCREKTAGEKIEDAVDDTTDAVEDVFDDN